MSENVEEEFIEIKRMGDLLSSLDSTIHTLAVYGQNNDECKSYSDEFISIISKQKQPIEIKYFQLIKKHYTNYYKDMFEKGKND